MSFRAPVKDQLFCMKELAGIDQIATIPGFEDAGFETAQAVLEESAKFNEGVVAPLNWSGDQDHGSWDNGVVRASKGFKEAYAALAEGGWQGLGQPLEYGGQGLPKIIGAACVEQTMAANLSFSLCSILTGGAIEALLTAGSDELKTRYIPNMVSGKWTGTMNLTEPQAGSDLALVRSKAVKQDDGTYRISGQKIFITYGEHDMVENIVHLVLARTPDAPEGVKGISLFVVPKFMVNADGSLGQRNDVYCASIEEKLGIKASPTAVLVYGDDKGEVGPGAIGYLVGEENRGLEYMFIMMNAARYDVGLQGIAVSERAYQHAVPYAKDRVQSRPVGGAAQAGESLGQTAVGELGEETGLVVPVEDMIGPVWRREATIDFNGSVMRSEEYFFVHRTRHFEPATAGHSALERSYIHGHRWCDATMVRELVATGEPVYPVQLAELLVEANRMADGRSREAGGRDESQPRPIR